jgi:UDPglucose 6-dehydrogenase
LTEANSIKDFENTNRIILGGTEEDALVVGKLFERKLIPRGAMIWQCDSTSAELIKLFTNAYLATKVTFANEMYRVCDKLGTDYAEVMTLACLDKRIAYSHLKVPGPDGDFGFGGHCFPKDINSLRHVAKQLGTGERLFSAVIERNEELRADKDWLSMPGRAVVEDYEE